MIAAISTLSQQSVNSLFIKPKHSFNFLFGSRTLFVCVTRLSKDDYQTLGIKPNASKGEIKAAYFEKAKLLHPDANQENSDQKSNEFHQLNEAYNRLMSGVSPQATRYRNPRDDPQMREYWRTRERQRQEIKFQYDEEFKKRFETNFGSRDGKVLRRLFWSAFAFWVLMIGYPLFSWFNAHPKSCHCTRCFQTVSYHQVVNSACKCERCSLILIQNNPTIAELLNLKK